MDDYNQRKKILQAAAAEASGSLPWELRDGGLQETLSRLKRKDPTLSQLSYLFRSSQDIKKFSLAIRNLEYDDVSNKRLKKIRLYLVMRKERSNDGATMTSVVSALAFRLSQLRYLRHLEWIGAGSAFMMQSFFEHFRPSSFFQSLLVHTTSSRVTLNVANTLGRFLEQHPLKEFYLSWNAHSDGLARVLQTLASLKNKKHHVRGNATTLRKLHLVGVAMDLAASQSLANLLSWKNHELEELTLLPLCTEVGARLTPVCTALQHDVENGSLRSLTTRTQFGDYHHGYPSNFGNRIPLDKLLSSIRRLTLVGSNPPGREYAMDGNLRATVQEVTLEGPYFVHDLWRLPNFLCQCPHVTSLSIKRAALAPSRQQQNNNEDDELHTYLVRNLVQSLTRERFPYLRDLSLGSVGDVLVEALGNEIGNFAPTLQSLTLLTRSSITNLQPLIQRIPNSALCHVRIVTLPSNNTRNNNELSPPPRLGGQEQQSLEDALHDNRFRLYGGPLLLGNEPPALWPLVLNRLGNMVAPFSPQDEQPKRTGAVSPLLREDMRTTRVTRKRGDYGEKNQLPARKAWYGVAYAILRERLDILTTTRRHNDNNYYNYYKTIR